MISFFKEDGNKKAENGGIKVIQVMGKSFEFQGNLELDQVEKNILQYMQEDHIVYSYISSRELLFEIKLRKNIIKSAKEMNETKPEFTIFEQARCNRNYWQLTKAGGFLLRPDVRPSDAIMDIFKNSSLYAFECATASVIIYYYATLKTIGHHLFNAHFQELYLYSWHTDTDLGLVTFYSDGFLPGDVVYFDNPDYNSQTPWFRGVNAILLDDWRYFGHGFSIKTDEEIVQVLNKKRMEGSKQSAVLTSLLTRPSFSRLSALTNRQQTSSDFKIKQHVAHHNRSSISLLNYYNYIISLGYQYF